LGIGCCPETVTKAQYSGLKAGLMQTSSAQSFELPVHTDWPTRTGVCQYAS
jgi:hypothetical protein